MTKDKDQKSKTETEVTLQPSTDQTLESTYPFWKCKGSLGDHTEASPQD